MTTFAPARAFAACLLAASAVSGSAQSQRTRDIAFENVNVVAVDGGQVRRGQTVVVRDGVISAVGPIGSVSIPTGAYVMAGGGTRYLLPGLAGFHSHSIDSVEMAEYLRHGVTTIVHMGHATPTEIAAYRASVRAGKAVSRVYFGKRLNQPYGGQPGVTTPADGVGAVRAAREEGFDFIKAYTYLASETFFAITREAKAIGMPVYGHAVATVGLETTIDSGVSVVAHLEELMTSLGPQLDRARIQSVATMLRAKRTPIVTTLVALEEVSRQWSRPEVVRAYLGETQSYSLGPRWRGFWERGDLTRQSWLQSAVPVSRYDRARELAAVLTTLGVPLVVGTDAPGVAGVFAGKSMRDEFRNLIASGLTPLQTIRAATVTPASVLTATMPGAPAGGSIEVGKAADLLLLRTDPLADPMEATRPEGVMVRGEWFTAPVLAAMAVPAGAKAPAPAPRPTDVASPDAIVAALYESISGPAGQARDWNRFRSLFTPDARLLQTRMRADGVADMRVMSPDDYVSLSTSAAPVAFFEREIAQISETFGMVTHRFSTYDSKRAPTDSVPFARGINSIQLFKSPERWWVVTVFWDAERPGNALPEKYVRPRP